MLVLYTYIFTCILLFFKLYNAWYGKKNKKKNNKLIFSTIACVYIWYKTQNFSIPVLLWYHTPCITTLYHTPFVTHPYYTPFIRRFMADILPKRRKTLYNQSSHPFTEHSSQKFNLIIWQITALHSWFRRNRWEKKRYP